MTPLLHLTRPLLRALPRLLALTLLGLAVLVVTGHLRLQPVLTGSMRPAFPVGTLAAATPVAADRLRVGDVVMFVPPKPYGTPTGGPVMHRLVSITRGPDGHLQFRTKGDANQVKDPWTLDGSAGGFARVRASSFVAGKTLLLLRHTTSGPALLLWPGLLLLGLALRRSRGGDQPAVPAHTSPEPVRSRAARQDRQKYVPRHAA